MSKARVQTSRSAVPGLKPLPGTRDPGELYVNYADLQLGVIDPIKNPIDLLPIRFFSTAAAYSTNQFVVHNGAILRAPGSVSPGAFNPAQWEPLSVGLLDGQGPAYYLDFANMTGSITAGQHSVQSDPSLHAAATVSDSGFMTAAMVTKLNSLYVPNASQILASLLSVDGDGSSLDADLLDGQHGAYYRNRANHTGTQDIASITGLQTQLNLRLQDAPSNGQFYGRLNGGWATGITSAQYTSDMNAVSGSFSSVNATLGVVNGQIATLQSQMGLRLTDAPNNGVMYGRKNGSWVAAQEGLPSAPTESFVTSTGSVSVPANATHCIVEGVGGGGGGGGVNLLNAGVAGVGGGGGSGAYGRTAPRSLTGITSISVTIGAAGTGLMGASGLGGGDTLVTVGGTTITFGGGLGGTGMGGNAQAFLIEGGRGGGWGNVRGGSNDGNPGLANASIGLMTSGAGAGSEWGRGGAALRLFGASGSNLGGNGSGAQGYGSGGGGACQMGAQGLQRAGGNGTQGAVCITWLYNMS